MLIFFKLFVLLFKDDVLERKSKRFSRVPYFCSHFSLVRQTINNSHFLFSRMRPDRRTFGEGSFSHFLSVEEWIPCDGCGSHVHDPFGNGISCRRRSGKAVIHTDHVRDPRNWANEVLRFTFRPRQLIYVATNNINQLPARLSQRGNDVAPPICDV